MTKSSTLLSLLYTASVLLTNPQSAFAAVPEETSTTSTSTTGNTAPSPENADTVTTPNQTASTEEGSDSTEGGNSMIFQYTGPTACASDGSILGYSNLKVLNDDMFVNFVQVVDGENKELEGVEDTADEKTEHVYTICPGAVLDVDAAFMQNLIDASIVPSLTNTTIQCGTRGTSNGNCVIKGGQFQLMFHPGLLVGNVKVKGMTFSGGYGVSVAGWGHPMSSVLFEDCVWKENQGHTGVEQYYEPIDRRQLQESEGSSLYYHAHKNKIVKSRYTQFANQRKFQEASQIGSRHLQGFPAMFMSFSNSQFLRNQQDVNVMLNAGGLLEVENSDFSENQVGLSVISTIYGGHILIHTETSFSLNQSPAFTVFVDSDSYLELNEGNSKGGMNIISSKDADTVDTCNDGIFLENKGSYCLFGGICTGDCCPFGDESCDRHDPSPNMDSGTSSSPIPDVATPSEQTLEDLAVSEPDLKFTAPKAVSVNHASQSAGGGSCGNGCIAMATLVPLLVIVLGLLTFKLIRKRNEIEEQPQLGSPPEQEIA